MNVRSMKEDSGLKLTKWAQHFHKGTKKRFMLTHQHTNG